MRAIQSLWTKPGLKYRNKFAFNSIKDFLVFTELSAKILKQYFDEVIFYTDREGHQIIKPIKSVYSNVVVCMNDLDHIDESNWAIPKIYAQTLQKAAFIHVDNDVFLRDAINPDFYGKDYLFQNIEGFYNREYYERGINNLKEVYLELWKSNEDIDFTIDYAYNCGVIGMKDISKVKQHFDMALKFIDIKKQLNGDCLSFASIQFEQWFSAMLYPKERTTFILDEHNREILGVRYIHLLSGSKKDKENVRLVRDINKIYA